MVSPDSDAPFKGTFLEVPIPSYKIGKPRFSARGSAFFSINSRNSHRTSTSTNTNSARESSQWSLGDYTGRFPAPPRSSHGNGLQAPYEEEEQEKAGVSLPPAIASIPPPETVIEEEEEPRTSLSIRPTSVHPVRPRHVVWQGSLGVRRLLGSVRRAWKTGRVRLLRSTSRADMRPPSRAASIALCNFGRSTIDEDDQGPRREKRRLRYSRSAPGLSLHVPEGPLSPRITSDMTMGSRSIIIMDGTDTNPTARQSTDLSPRDTHLGPPSAHVHDRHSQTSHGGQEVPIYFSNAETTSPVASSTSQPHGIDLEDGSITTAELLKQGSALRDSVDSFSETPQIEKANPMTILSRKSGSSLKTTTFNPTTHAPDEVPRPMTTYDSHETLSAASYSPSSEQATYEATYFDDASSDVDGAGEHRQQRGLRRLPGGGNLRSARNVHQLERSSFQGPGLYLQTNVPTVHLDNITEEMSHSMPASASPNIPFLHTRGSQRSSGLSTFYIPSRPPSFTRSIDLDIPEEDESGEDIHHYLQRPPSSIPSASSQTVAPLRVINRSKSPDASTFFSTPMRDHPLVPSRSSSARASVRNAVSRGPNVPERSSSAQATSQPNLLHPINFQAHKANPAAPGNVAYPMRRRSLSEELAAIADLPDSDEEDGGVEAALARLEGRSSVDELSLSPSYATYEMAYSPSSPGIGKAV